jgi:AraC family transcriptional activator of pobA
MTHSSITKRQHHSGNDMTLTTVPKVRLYVERPETESWFVNVGHVTDRGRWRTAPHAHPDYGQVIFVRSGCGVMNLEGSSVRFEGPCALLLPTESVHGLDYEMDVDRWVVTIERAYLSQVNAKLREFTRLWAQARVIPLSYTRDAASGFLDVVGKLEREVADKPLGHVAGTEALLTSLLLMLARGTELEYPEGEAGSRNDIRLAERFRDLIEQHYRENLALQDYASLLAVSLVQLRAACASAMGQSPAKMIHARIITEAKRNLIFGDMSMEQIAFGLGFSNAAYFTRFFRKEVGQAPSQFRITSRQQQ